MIRTFTRITYVTDRRQNQVAYFYSAPDFIHSINIPDLAHAEIQKHLQLGEILEHYEIENYGFHLYYVWEGKHYTDKELKESPELRKGFAKDLETVVHKNVIDTLSQREPRDVPIVEVIYPFGTVTVL